MPVKNLTRYYSFYHANCHRNTIFNCNELNCCKLGEHEFWILIAFGVICFFGIIIIIAFFVFIRQVLIRKTKGHSGHESKIQAEGAVAGGQNLPIKGDILLSVYVEEIMTKKNITPSPATPDECPWMTFKWPMIQKVPRGKSAVILHAQPSKPLQTVPGSKKSVKIAAAQPLQTVPGSKKSVKIAAAQPKMAVKSTKSVGVGKSRKHSDIDINASLQGP